MKSLRALSAAALLTSSGCDSSTAYLYPWNADWAPDGKVNLSHYTAKRDENGPYSECAKYQNAVNAKMGLIHTKDAEGVMLSTRLAFDSCITYISGESMLRVAFLPEAKTHFTYTLGDKEVQAVPGDYAPEFYNGELTEVGERYAKIQARQFHATSRVTELEPLKDECKDLAETLMYGPNDDYLSYPPKQVLEGVHLDRFMDQYTRAVRIVIGACQGEEMQCPSTDHNVEDLKCAKWARVTE